MMSSTGKMIENYFSILWHYPILQVTKIVFGYFTYLKFIRKSLVLKSQTFRCVELPRFLSIENVVNKIPKLDIESVGHIGKDSNNNRSK